RAEALVLLPLTSAFCLTRQFAPMPADLFAGFILNWLPPITGRSLPQQLLKFAEGVFRRASLGGCRSSRGAAVAEQRQRQSAMALRRRLGGNDCGRGFTCRPLARRKGHEFGR